MTTRRAQLTATLSVAMLSAAMLTGCTGSPAPEETPTSTAPVPTAAVTPTLTAQPDGGGLDARPHNQIPWAEVGPGWFLIEAKVAEDTVSTQASSLPVFRSTDRLYLLAPNGDLYDAGTLAGLDVSQGLVWLSTGLLLAREVATQSQYREADLEEMDLTTGRTERAAARTRLPDVALANADGVLITATLGAESATYSIGDTPVCEQQGARGASLAPKGDYLVCFSIAGEEGERTAVSAIRVQGSHTTIAIGDYGRPASTYAFAGWAHDGAYYFARLDDAGVWHYFMQEVPSGVLTEYVPPVAASGLVSHNAATRTFWVAEPNAITFFDQSGSLLARAECRTTTESALPEPLFSGPRAVLTCAGTQSGGPWTTTVTLVNLTTGAVLEVASLETDGDFNPLRNVFAYPVGD